MFLTLSCSVCGWARRQTQGKSAPCSTMTPRAQRHPSLRHRLSLAETIHKEAKSCWAMSVMLQENRRVETPAGMSCAPDQQSPRTPPRRWFADLWAEKACTQQLPATKLSEMQWCPPTTARSKNQHSSPVLLIASTAACRCSRMNRTTFPVKSSPARPSLASPPRFAHATFLKSGARTSHESIVKIVGEGEITSYKVIMYTVRGGATANEARFSKTLNRYPTQRLSNVFSCRRTLRLPPVVRSPNLDVHVHEPPPSEVFTKADLGK